MNKKIFSKGRRRVYCDLFSSIPLSLLFALAVPTIKCIHSVTALAGEPACFTQESKAGSTPAAPPQKGKVVLLDIPDIADRINDVVVNIRGSSTAGGENLGSGFIIDKKGLIVTNFHLISAGPQRSPLLRPADTDQKTKLVDRVLVTLHDGRQFPASVKGFDEATDIALLQIVPTDSPLPVAELGDSDRIRVGEWVIAVGNPLGLDHTVTLGIVSAKGRAGFGGQFDDYLQTDAAINPGNSGGPLVNTEGKIVGINTLVLGGTQGLSFSIPINTLKSILPQLIETGRVARGFLGVETRDLDPDIRGANKLPPDQQGVIVVRSERGTPAASAGIRKDDVILSVDGVAVTSYVQLNRIIADKSPGTKVSLKILRDGREYTLSAEIGTEK
ncbi:MAG: trypsin-like peptidase domain-containing protein [Blastocatellia bacterium]|nr:trypsin-like peptidase domain-containing protein [Blastocatellia bacterium]